MPHPALMAGLGSAVQCTAAEAQAVPLGLVPSEGGTDPRPRRRTIEEHLWGGVHPGGVGATLGYCGLHAVRGQQLLLARAGLLVGLQRHVVLGVQEVGPASLPRRPLPPRRRRWVIYPLVVHVVDGLVAVLLWHRAGGLLPSRRMCRSRRTAAAGAGQVCSCLLRALPARAVSHAAAIANKTARGPENVRVIEVCHPRH